MRFSVIYIIITHDGAELLSYNGRNVIATGAPDIVHIISVRSGGQRQEPIVIFRHIEAQVPAKGGPIHQFGPQYHFDARIFEHTRIYDDAANT